MIPAGVQIFFALDPVDMRCGFERLSAVVRDRIGYEPTSGALFAFVNRRRSTMKVIYADATGLCLFSKRLHRGTFVIPDAPTDTATHVEVDEVMLDALLDGVLPSGHDTSARGRGRTH